MERQINYLIDEALGDGDEAGKDGVQGEDDVVGLDGVDARGVLLEVVPLDGLAPVEAGVEHAVEDEADHVQAQEVKVEPNDAEERTKNNY